MRGVVLGTLVQAAGGGNESDGGRGGGRGTAPRVHRKVAAAIAAVRIRIIRIIRCIAVAVGHDVLRSGRPVT